MALYYELQVFKDVYTLVQKVFLYTQDFPLRWREFVTRALDDRLKNRITLLLHVPKAFGIRVVQISNE